MTYAEYNTDEYFNNKDSTADGLIKAAFDEGKTREEVENSLSPLWKADKKGNVKKALDTYYKTETPKEESKAEEQKPTEEKVTEKVIEETAPKKNAVNKQTEEYMNTNNAISYAQEDAENKRQSDELGKRWDARLANIDKMSDFMKNIDDHYLNNLPTFMFKRYANGEFGDLNTKEGKKDAIIRLGYFLVNGLQSKLKVASNLAMANAGKSPMFSDTQSDFEKIQNSNLSNALDNRWNKYKQETQSAIDLAKQGGMSEESITDSIATISSNNRLQSAFNQMNERQKVFALHVLGEIGNKMGNMNDSEFANTLMGMSAMGDSLDYKEAAGMLIYRFIKDPTKRDAALSELGLLGGGTNIIAGIGGGLLGGGEKEETGTTLEDGTKIDPGKAMSKKELKELKTEAEKLGNKYYNGEITEEQFRKDYAKLENIMSQHGIRSAVSGGIKSADDYIKQIAKNKLTELSNSLYDLNDNAKNYTKDEYLKKYNEYKTQAEKWGISEKDLKSVEKEKEKALKKVKK